MAQNPYRLVEDDNSSLMDTIYYERDGRLPTFKISALLPNREERFGVYEIKIDKKTIAVLDFAMPGGLVTFYNKPAIAMGVFMDYAAPSREVNTRTFTIGDHMFTWTLYPKLAANQISFECVESTSRGIVARYEPDPDQPAEGPKRATFRLSPGTEQLVLELLCSLVIVRHNMKYRNAQ